MIEEKIPTIDPDNFTGTLGEALKIGMIQVPSEILSLADLYLDSQPKKEPKKILEIGTKYGGTTYFLAKTFPNAEVITLDMPRNFPYTESAKIRDNWLYALFGNRVKPIACDSHSQDTLRTISTMMPEIDILFIDGDHTYPGVKLDFEMYHPLVKKGGITAFHDIVDSEHHRVQNCYVAQYWEEIKEFHKYTQFVSQADQNWAGIGVIFK